MIIPRTSDTEFKNGVITITDGNQTFKMNYSNVYITRNQEYTDFDGSRILGKSTLQLTATLFPDDKAINLLQPKEPNWFNRTFKILFG